MDDIQAWQEEVTYMRVRQYICKRAKVIKNWSIRINLNQINHQSIVLLCHFNKISKYIIVKKLN